MITQFKIFEDWSSWKTIKDDNPRKGDYVLLRFPKSYGYSQDFFDNNIGQIIKRSGSDYVVKFDKYWDYSDVSGSEIVKDVLDFSKNGYTMSIVGTDIKYYDKNKEELEQYIDANKYNL